MNMKKLAAAVLSVTLAMLAAESFADERYYDNRGNYVGRKTDS
jgi:hypothetical protein